MNSRVAEFIAKHAEWKEILLALRTVCLDCSLTETIKWGTPVYMANKKNIVGLVAFKTYAGLWFYDGSELTDPESVLINAQPEKTQKLRQWRFEKHDIVDTGLVMQYLKEAIAN